MDWPLLILIPLRLGLLFAGLLGPGLLVLRALSLPRSLAGAFLISMSALYLGVLALAVTHSPVSLLSLALGPAIVGLIAFVVGRREREATSPSPWFPWFHELGGWLPLFTLVALIVGFRLCVEPLSGPDVHFRWSYLAEQMLRLRSLDFYPAHRPEDFLRYFWPESIPPGIAGLYAWCYACGGSLHPLWTSPAVLLQLLALMEICWSLASSWGGPDAGRRALLLLAGCPLLLWSYLLGQETGLLATAVAGLAWYLHQTRESPRWLVLLVAAALVASATREYGLGFAFVTGALLWASPEQRSAARLYNLIALPLVLVWPIRCWLKTGNPFYSLGLGGLFPVNGVFAAWNHDFLANQQTHLHQAAFWIGLGRYLALWALPACFGLVALFWLWARGERRLRALAVLASISFLLWLVSVPFTAGGLFYTLRVLSPALALLIVTAAIGGEKLPVAGQRVAAVLLALVLLESAPRTLVLPDNPYRMSPSEWPTASRRLSGAWHEGDAGMVAQLTRLRGERLVVTDNFDLPHLGVPAGCRVAPLWTPDFAWFFDATLSPEEAARRWQASGIRVLIVGQTGPTMDFLHRAPHWSNPRYRLELSGAVANHLVLRFSPMAPAAP